MDRNPFVAFCVNKLIRLCCDQTDACICVITESFHLIEFMASQTVSVISSLWTLGSNKCCYPKWEAKKVAIAAKNHMEPECEWQVFEMRIKHTSGKYKH